MHILHTSPAPRPALPLPLSTELLTIWLSVPTIDFAKWTHNQSCFPRTIFLDSRTQILFG